MITILREEPHFLLVDKPAGLFSQAAPGVDSLQVALVAQLKERDAHEGNPFIGLPHRLDRGTSGIMLIARNQRALKRFGQQFQSRKIGKFYLAVAERSAGCELGSTPTRWEDYVRKVTDRPVAEIVAAEEEGARLAQLDVQQIAEADGLCLLLVHLHTGRMHQIRVQAAARGLHVVGDALYHPEQTEPEQNEPAIAAADGERPKESFALFAMRIEFRHPQTALQTSGTAPMPECMLPFPEPIVTAATRLVERSQAEDSSSWKLGELL